VFSVKHRYEASRNLAERGSVGEIKGLTEDTAEVHGVKSSCGIGSPRVVNFECRCGE
jgi:hypothetical protein